MSVSNVTSATGSSLVDAPVGTNPNGILGKDDFLKLLLVELKYQDPTAPMDTEKILSQTSQLATLESTENTNKALSNLATSLGTNMQFSTISAIGKIADLGNDMIALDDGQQSSFELYFPSAVASGDITITDSSGNVVKTIGLGTNDKGVFQFAWDGTTDDGGTAEAGLYHVNAYYIDPSNAPHNTHVGTYPIQSVRFDGDQTLVSLGSSYVPFEAIKEIYEG